MPRTSRTKEPANEGEGNKTAARAHNDAQRRFAGSGRVGQKAREAERALDGPERPELEAAEATGKIRAAKKAPQVAKGVTAGQNEDAIRTRAYQIWEREGRPDGKDRDHWRQAETEMAETQT